MIRDLVILLCVVAGLCIPPPPRPFLPANVTVHPGSGRIINGFPANPGEFPYIVSLKDEGGGHSCAGSILNQNWVLTAAHCCLTGSQEYVYTSSIFLSSGGLSFDILEMRVHSEYDPNNFWRNDICLVRINGSIPYGPDAQQVTLPGSGLLLQNNVPVLVPGWGYTSANAPQKIPDRLQVLTQYTTRTSAMCKSLTDIPEFSGYICAIGSVGNGACQGDSGGPLIYRDLTDGDLQMGIASFVFLPCGTSGYPDYYTRVASYIRWIEQHLGDEASTLKFATLKDFIDV